MLEDRTITVLLNHEKLNNLKIEYIIPKESNHDKELAKINSKYGLDIPFGDICNLSLDYILQGHMTILGLGNKIVLIYLPLLLIPEQIAYLDKIKEMLDQSILYITSIEDKNDLDHMVSMENTSKNNQHFIEELITKKKDGKTLVKKKKKDD